MLTIIVPGAESYNERTNEFSYGKDTKLTLEHSLVSIAKWEAKWHKPFLNNDKKTSEQVLDYIKCMTITQNIGDDVYMRLSTDNISKIDDYIEDPSTATWFSTQEGAKGGRREVITSELIYYWMTCFNIPFECQKWHINRLLTLIRICSIKSQPNKKMSPNAIRARNRDINAARRKMMHTKG